jgi:hypothetical protein
MTLCARCVIDLYYVAIRRVFCQCAQYDYAISHHTIPCLRVVPLSIRHVSRGMSRVNVTSTQSSRGWAAALVALHLCASLTVRGMRRR